MHSDGDGPIAVGSVGWVQPTNPLPWPSVGFTHPTCGTAARLI